MPSWCSSPTLPAGESFPAADREVAGGVFGSRSQRAKPRRSRILPAFAEVLLLIWRLCSGFAGLPVGALAGGLLLAGRTGESPERMRHLAGGAATGLAALPACLARLLEMAPSAPVLLLLVSLVLFRATRSFVPLEQRASCRVPARADSRITLARMITPGSVRRPVGFSGLARRLVATRW